MSMHPKIKKVKNVINRPDKCNSLTARRPGRRDVGLIPGLERSPGKRKWQPTPVFLPGKSHAQWSLVGYSPWGCKRVGHDLVTKQQQINTRMLEEYKH